MDTYVCEFCGVRWEKTMSEEDALREYKENFGNNAPEDKAICCDDCYRQLMTQFN